MTTIVLLTVGKKTTSHGHTNMSLFYKIIDTLSPKTNDEIKIINKCFSMWINTFGADLSSRGAVLNKDEFHRARILAVLITDTNEVAGFHLYCPFFLNESPSLEHSYLKVIPEEIKENMLQRKIHSLMAMEYLTVAPSFRKSESGGPNIAQIIVRLGLKVMNNLNLDAAIGIARIDRKVNFLGETIGFETLGEIEKFNNKCSIMLFPKNKKAKKTDEFTEKMIDSLWNQKQIKKAA
ncbi:MAG: hypothetical protein ACXVCY_04240 [Pseudobdellovibrionaceae bacterium]